MQHTKDKKSISEITKYCGDSKKLTGTFEGLLKNFNLTYINTLFSKTKTKGIDSKKIFQILFTLRFLELKNIRQLMLAGYSKGINFKKDVFYEFMKNPYIDWRRIVHLFYKQVASLIDKESEEKDCNPKCLIIDDSLLPKSGKRIEFIGKVYDHCSHTYNLGIKLLTLGLFDGKSFMPLNFSLHNEPGKTKKRGLKSKDLKAQFSKERNSLMAGFHREIEISKDKISTAISMVKTAINKGIKAKYVLVDSWFTTEKFISEIHKIKKELFVIGLMKTNRIIIVKQKKYKANQIPELKRKQIKYCRKLNCHYIPLQINYKDIEMKAFWIKMKGQQIWKMLICTDKKLTFIKAMKQYQIRWSIEVFFKDCKQNLHLNSCQSTDFDANIAHISIVFMNYMILSLRKRIDDYETFGGIFREIKEQMLEDTLIEKIWIIFVHVYNILLADLGVDWEAFVRMLIEAQEELNNQIKSALECVFSLNRRTS